MPRLRVLGALAAVVVLGVAGPATASSSAAGAMDGPDLASYQHPGGARVDWAQVARSGARFAFVKATEGTSYTNPYFAADYRGAHQAGLPRSAYHYARPSGDLTTARDQADFFVRTAGTASAKGDLPLTLDLEESGGLAAKALVAWTHAFVDEVTALTSRPVILYTYPSFWQSAMGNSNEFTSLPLWIASYRSGGPRSPLPGGWSSWTFWQYTSDGRVAGIPTTVDRSKFDGSASALQALSDPTAGPAPAGPGPLPLPLPVPSHAPPPVG